MDFQQAIAQANQLLGKGAAAITADELAPFLSSEESARGFFVAYLTGDCGDAPAALVEGLRGDVPIAQSVLVRNLVMASATEAAHRRSGDEEKAWASAAVADKAGELISQVDARGLWSMLVEMRKTLLAEADTFAQFLGRQNYSDDEKLCALTSVNQVLALRKVHDTGVLDLADPIE
jgi:hypothetical protein